MKDQISIVGGGPSFLRVGSARVPGFIIAVNDSAVHLTHFDIGVSMDRLWTEYRWPEIQALPQPFCIRQSALKNVWHKGGERMGNRLHVFNNNRFADRLSDKEGHLNGVNSGACAINLAYQLKPTRLFLFGFDMKKGADGRPYWHDPYPWNARGATKPGHYVDWAKQMETYLKQMVAAGIDVTVITDHRWAKGLRFLTPEQFKGNSQ